MENSRISFKPKRRKISPWRKPLILIMALLINLIFLSGAIKYGATDESFFDKTFEKLDSREKVGLSVTDFEKVKDLLIDYVGLKTDVFEAQVTIDGKKTDFFNDKERTHMVDVRNLFILNDKIFKASMLLTGIFYVAARFILGWRRTLAEALANSGWMMLLFVFGLGLLATQDFTAVFTKFHELFFSNDLWLLDPSTDRMIVLLEEGFFMSMALHIGIYAALASVVGTAVGYVARRNVG